MNHLQRSLALLAGMSPAEKCQLPVIEGLDAEVNAVATHISNACEFLRGDVVGVALDGKFSSRREGKDPGEALQQGCQVPEVEQ